MVALRAIVREHDVHRWAEHCLAASSQGRCRPQLSSRPRTDPDGNPDAIPKSPPGARHDDSEVFLMPRCRRGRFSQTAERSATRGNVHHGRTDTATAVMMGHRLCRSGLCPRMRLRSGTFASRARSYRVGAGVVGARRWPRTARHLHSGTAIRPANAASDRRALCPPLRRQDARPTMRCSRRSPGPRRNTFSRT